MLGFNRRYRHLKRYRQIGEVLLKHGFGYLIQQIGIAQLLPPFKRLKALQVGQREEGIALGARLRMVLEQLGPTFIKFGQLLSTRPDIIPPDILIELEKLQDNVASIDYSLIKEVVESELERPIGEVFAFFDQEPLAAASISQVHRARLMDGTEVVVKVRRPRIEEIIGTDLEIMYRIANAVKDRFDDKPIDSVELVDSFAKMIRQEFDFTREGRSIERFCQNFADNPNVIIPKVYWEYSTIKVLTMDYIDGIKLRERIIINEQNIDVAKLADIAVDAFVAQVFDFGFFHGDPHPGNLMVTSSGELVFIDFGIVGRIEPQTIKLLANLIVAVTRRDVDGLLDVLSQLDAFNQKPSREMYLDILELFDLYYDKTLKELDFSIIAEDLLAFTRNHPVRVPSDLILLIKALVTVEGIGASLTPDFNIMENLEPIARKWIKENYNAKHLTKEGYKQASKWVKSVSNIPVEFESLLGTINRGELKIQFEHRGLDLLINRLDIASNRLTAGLIVGSLIVGSSFVMVMDQGPRLLSLPIVGVLGFLLAAMIGLWLVISILRSGRY